MVDQAFMTIAQAIRAAIPLGIHADSAFLPISDSLRAPSLIPPPASVTEVEVRRNTFWLLYAMERMGGCSNGWPMSLDDQDVSQLLPVKGSDFGLEASMILQCRLCDCILILVGGSADYLVRGRTATCFGERHTSVSP
jgi:hypothetical protein